MLRRLTPQAGAATKRIHRKTAENRNQLIEPATHHAYRAKHWTSSLTGTAGEHADTQVRSRTEGPFLSRYGQIARREESFLVIRQLPEAGGVLQYQIQAEMDGHSRVVRESQLADL
jgi:hypothetical protein